MLQFTWNGTGQDALLLNRVTYLMWYLTNISGSDIRLE